MKTTGPQRIWTVAEAKTRLSEILQLAESEGPQRIGTRRRFVVVPAETWDAKTPPRRPLASGSSRTSHAAPILRCRTGGPIARFPSLTKKTNDRLPSGYQRHLGVDAGRSRSPSRLADAGWRMAAKRFNWPTYNLSISRTETLQSADVKATFLPSICRAPTGGSLGRLASRADSRPAPVRQNNPRPVRLCSGLSPLSRRR